MAGLLRHWPPAPSIKRADQWGAYPSEDDYAQAYKAWKLADQNLLGPAIRLDGAEKPSVTTGPTPVGPVTAAGASNIPSAATPGNNADGSNSNNASGSDLNNASGARSALQLRSTLSLDPDAGNEKPFDDHLVRNILKDLKANGTMKPVTPNSLAQIRRPGPNPDEPGPHGWSATEFLHDPERFSKSDIDGNPISKSRKHTLIDWCRERNLSTDGTVVALKDRLKQYMSSAATPLFPIADLGYKGYESPRYVVPSRGGPTYSAFELYTWAIYLSPYNPAYWTSRAYLFYQQGHYDLALGDAYRAFKLVRIHTDYTVRTNRLGLHPRIWDAIECHAKNAKRDDIDIFRATTSPNGVSCFMFCLRLAFHHIISLSLYGLSAMKDAELWDEYFKTHAILDQIDENDFKARSEFWALSRAAREFARGQVGKNPRQLWKHERRQGLIIPKPFPQLPEEPDRTNEQFLADMTRKYLWAWTEAESERVLELRRIASDDSNEVKVVAGQNIARGQLLLIERPGLRGHLQKPQSNVFWNKFHREKRKALMGLSPDANGQDPPPFHYDLKDTTQIKSGKGFRCENCKRPVPKEEVEVAISTYNPGFPEQSDGLELHCCPCLQQDPITYFCKVDPGESKIAVDIPLENLPARYTIDRPPKRKANDSSPSSPAKKQARRTRAASRILAEKKKQKELDDAAAEVSPELSCLDIAMAGTHRITCKLAWGWLQEGMRVKKYPNLDLLFDYEEHGTYLSLLLRDVFAQALIARAEANERGEPRGCMPYEVDSLLPLGGDQPAEMPFHFGWAANIAVPFETLEILGVNIWRDFDFDTWAIQKCLRKLACNAVVWDHRHRSQLGQSARQPQGHVQDHARNPVFRDMYVHTAFSLFNNGCGDAANASWTWDGDAGVPNRIIVTAKRDIEEREEILINYLPNAAGTGQQQRQELIRAVLGRDCRCEDCLYPGERQADYAVRGDASDEETEEESDTESVWLAAQHRRVEAQEKWEVKHRELVRLRRQRSEQIRQLSARHAREAGEPEQNQEAGNVAEPIVISDGGQGNDGNVPDLIVISDDNSGNGGGQAEGEQGEQV
ncbi:MAG: hypothetical protein M1829_003833 [Trizodia sp. TS-e1964]|nr:MAG: hypothetical protein M1829_003833 [Trizodia sp. TS-e1964]